MEYFQGESSSLKAFPFLKNQSNSWNYCTYNSMHFRLCKKKKSIFFCYVYVILCETLTAADPMWTSCKYVKAFCLNTDRVGDTFWCPFRFHPLICNCALCHYNTPEPVSKTAQIPPETLEKKGGPGLCCVKTKELPN